MRVRVRVRVKVRVWVGVGVEVEACLISFLASCCATRCAASTRCMYRVRLSTSAWFCTNVELKHASFLLACSCRG